MEVEELGRGEDERSLLAYVCVLCLQGRESAGVGRKKKGKAG